MLDCAFVVSDLFNVTATVQGDTITVNIVYDPSTITTATFQCQLDGVGDFENCECLQKFSTNEDNYCSDNT